MKELSERLQRLPRKPGIYFFKSKSGEIIYVGKAAVLKSRVKQYFQKSHGRDPKTEALVGEIAGLDWMVVDSELEALFLEAEMVKRYLPRYNILLRDDKAMTYIRVDYGSDYPTVSTTRRPLDDKARYFGPYLSEHSVRQALKRLRQIFPFATGRTGGQKRVSLHYHLGLDPGLEAGKTSLAAYRANLRRLMTVIGGKRKSVERELEKYMKEYAKNSRFEEAAKIRNQLFALRRLNQQVIFGNKEFQDLIKDHALVELTGLLGLYGVVPSAGASDARGPLTGDRPLRSQQESNVKSQHGAKESSHYRRVFNPAEGSKRRLRALRRLEGYDVSHTSGTDVVASMVVFLNGVPSKSDYRKFKTKINKNDDFYNISETLRRRFFITKHYSWSAARGHGFGGPAGSAITAANTGNGIGVSAQNRWKLDLPDFILIDGGKGQLSAALSVLEQYGLSIPTVGLAKRQEAIIVSKTRSNVNLNLNGLRKLGGSTQSSGDFVTIYLPRSANVVKLLQRIRDEAHRFAVSYHASLRNKRQTSSLLDNVQSIGPVTRAKLLKSFGTARAVALATEADLANVIGVKKAAILKQHLHDKQHAEQQKSARQRIGTT